MSIPIMSKVVDERFLQHRLKSTSLSGVIGGILAVILFFYRFNFDHVWSWDLFAIGITIVAVKLLAMIYYRVTD